MKCLFEMSSLEHTDIENIDKDTPYGLLKYQSSQ